MRLRALEPFAARGAVRSREAGREGEVPHARCELCGNAVADRHPHVVDLTARNVCCACKACSLLFQTRGAAKGRYRTVPERVLLDPAFVLGEAEWAALEIPVRLAFFFFHSGLSRWVAIYPGPAGAVESELPLPAWEPIAQRSALVQAAEPDVEAVLARGSRARNGFEHYLVPIDACYQLVGTLRQKWRGFDGGDDVRREVDGFFHQLRERGEPVRPAAPKGS
jgi:hypothetical protein